MFRQHLLILPLLAAISANCDASNNTPHRAQARAEPVAAPSAVSREDRELLEKIKARERAKEELTAQPARFISGGKWDVVDKGIINSYTRASAIEFTNTSQFDVSELSGKLTYLDAKGVEMATVPFTATGELRSGQTAKLKVTAGEITGSARTGKIIVERLRILSGA